MSSKNKLTASKEPKKLKELKEPKQPKQPKKSKKSKEIEIKVIRGTAKPQVPTFAAVENAKAVLTARSLLLDQDVSITPMRFGSVGEKLEFNHGSLTHSLGLSPDDLWNFKGKRVLDLAGGASIFGEELVTVFGAEGVYVVDNDANLKERIKQKTKITGTTMTNRKAVGKIYEANMKTLTNLVPQSTEWEDIHKALLENASATTGAYFQSDKVLRMEGDATDMREILDLPDCVDVTINSWMMMYLEEGDRKKALKEMIRVTRPGGRIIIQGGNETADKGKKTDKSKCDKKGDNHAVSTKKFAAWFKEYKKGKDTFVFEKLGMEKSKKTAKITKKTVKLADKAVKINKERSVGPLLVLEIV